MGNRTKSSDQAPAAQEEPPHQPLISESTNNPCPSSAYSIALPLQTLMERTNIMTTTHSDPSLPCDKCGKRHSRTDEASSRRTRSIIFRVPLLISALAAIAAVATTTHGSIPTVDAAVYFPSLQMGNHAVPSGEHGMVRHLQEDTHSDEADDHHAHEEDEHVEEEAVDEDHSGHDHGEEEAVDEDHSGHDHGDEEEEDDHSGHDHGEEEDDHSGHDHGEEEEEDDHSGHDHGEEEFNSFASTKENSAQESDSLPWGQVIGATLLVNLASLSGCLIVVMASIHRGIIKLRASRDEARNARRMSGIALAPNTTLHGQGTFFDICIPAFAVGALVATAVFLIFPEALHLIEGGHGVDSHADHADEASGAHDDHSGHDHRYLQEDSHAGHDDDSESQNAAKFGCAILGGFLLPFVFAIFFHHDKPEEDDPSVPISDTRRDEATCASCNPDVETGVSVVVKTIKVDDEETPPPPQDRHEGCDICEEDGKDDTTEPANGQDWTWLDKDKADGEGENAPPEETSPEPEQQREEPSPEQASTLLPTKKKSYIDRSLCASILLGDAFHNFADGVFIAAAFKSCSIGTAISIILVTLFHEIAQELADFILLTRYAGLSVIKACALNFLSGLSVCLGGIVFLAANPSDQATGIMLAMAGGVYFNIAACETIPRIDKQVKGRMDRVWTFISVIVGTVPIGLILLNHQHCA